jgi:glycosyltransferase
MIIVTLTKNSSKTINDTIFSIENQSLKNIKWIILDDNSTDDTLDKIYKSYIKKEIIKISSSGLFHAYNISYNFLFNKNFDDIIFFLHSDDIIYDKFVLEKIEFQFNKHKLDSLFGNIVYFKDDQFKYFRNWNNSEMNSKTIEDNLFLIKKFKKRDLFTGWTFPHTSFFFSFEDIAFTS